ncbi:MAG: hypothetical protein MUD08_09415 [Cytophagales bacterium]|nr:hypothetical protein [Cytophagales bacterium]
MSISTFRSRCAAALTGLALVAAPAVAQDVIYQANGKKTDCKIVDVGPQKIKYRIPQNPGPSYSMEAADVLMAFSGAGNYVVFPVADAAQAAGFTTPPANKQADVLVTADNKAMAATGVAVTDKEVRFKDPADKKAKEQKLPRAKVVAVLYQDGRHELLTEPAKAATSLQAAKAQVDQLTGVDNTPKANANTGTTPPKDDVAFPGGPEEFEKFRNKALLKVDELGTYLATVVDPKTPADKANATIDLAVTLFVNEDARVEVSNVNTGVKNKYKIRDYLRRLKLVGSGYQEVEVSYADISYATDFRKGPDGNYYGVVSFVQTFKGLVDGKVVYGDVTQRNVTVILKLYEKAVDGETKKLWDVFLADVGIEETRKL